MTHEVINPKEEFSFDVDGEDRYELEIFSKENPFSIASKLTATDSKILENCDTDLLGSKDEMELKEELKPNATLNKIRNAFWIEYDMACRLGRKIDMRRVYSGICTKEYFMQSILNKKKACTWLLCPVSSYKVSMEEALLTAISNMRKMLDAPLFIGKEVDHKQANLVLKIYKELDQRVHGSIVQKIETKSLHIRKDADKIPVNANLDEEIAKMKEQLIIPGEVLHGRKQREEDD